MTGVICSSLENEILAEKGDHMILEAIRHFARVGAMMQFYINTDRRRAVRNSKSLWSRDPLLRSPKLRPRLCRNPLAGNGMKSYRQWFNQAQFLVR